MKNTTNIVRIMCEVGIFAAIGFVLDEFQGALAVSFPNGGSIGIAMVAVLLIAYRRGGLAGIFTGLIIGCLDLLTKAYIYHPAQLFLDYILPYALVGVTGFLKPLLDKSETKKKAILWICVGALLGGTLKFLSHFLSGVIFFNDPSGFAWNLTSWNPVAYSLVYNFAYIGPSIALCIAFLIILYWRVPQIVKIREVHLEKTPKDERAVYAWGVTIIYIVGGLTGFIWSLIVLIRSALLDHRSGYDKFSTNQDCVVICVLCLMLVVAGIISLISLIRKKHTNGLLVVIFPIVASIATLYPVAKIIKIAIDGGAFVDYQVYVYWMIIAFLLLVLGIIALSNHLKNKRGEEF